MGSSWHVGHQAPGTLTVEEVYQEVIEDVLKQARSPHVLGHG